MGEGTCQPWGTEDALRCGVWEPWPCPCLVLPDLGCTIQRDHGRSEGRRAGRPEAQKPGRD